MFDMQSFLSGLALGLAGKPLALAREPVAYLYGEDKVRLPKLPDSDKPYAIIMGDIDLRNTYAYFSDSPVAYGAQYISNTYVDVSYYSQDGEVVMYLYNSGKWTGLFSDDPMILTLEAGDSPPNGNGLLWTNTDIHHDANGKIYMAASDPVPVYE